MKIFFISLVAFFFLNNLYALELNGKFDQGNLIRGKTNIKSKIFIDGKEVRVSAEGFFVFGIEKDRKTNISIKVVRTGL